MIGIRGCIIPLACAFLAVFGAGAQGSNVVYNESVSGDLSSTQASPTIVPLTFLGQNSVIGTVGGTDTQDWITIQVPSGMQLSGLIHVSYSNVGTDTQGFMGFQSNTLAFVGSAGTASPYTGYIHWGTTTTNTGGVVPINTVGSELLQYMKNSAVSAGASKNVPFTTPLPAGNYAFLIQQLGSSTSYEFNFTTSAVVSTPEPSSLCLIGIAIGGAAGARVYRRWRNKTTTPVLAA